VDAKRSSIIFATTKKTYILVSMLSLRKEMKTYLGHDDDLLAREVMLFDSLAEDNFGETIRVYVGRIECPNFDVIRCFVVLNTLFFIKDLQTSVSEGGGGENREANVPKAAIMWSVGHAPENDLGYFQAGLAQAN
jgi:hypothetical protein